MPMPIDSINIQILIKFPHKKYANAVVNGLKEIHYLFAKINKDALAIKGI